MSRGSVGTRHWGTLGLGLSLLGVLAAPVSAWAGPVESDRFDNSKQVMLADFNDIAFNTGWIPSGSPVQMKIDVAAANTLAVSMFGTAEYDWGSEQLRFEGDPSGGDFRYDVGVLLHAEVLVDVVGFQWQSDLLGPYDLLIDDDAEFTPYLLNGSTDAPVIVEDSTTGVTVASVPLVPDILIASGNLDIDVSFDVSASLSGKSIRASGPLNEATVITEGESVAILADAGQDPEGGSDDAMHVEAQLTARVTTSTTVIVRPHLVFSVFGTDYDIAGIDIPIDLPEYDDDFVFDPVDLAFDRPEPAGESDGGSASDGGSGSSGDAGEGETGDGASEAGIDDGDAGCSCRSAAGSRTSLAWGPLLLLPLLSLRRRRRGERA